MLPFGRALPDADLASALGDVEPTGRLVIVPVGSYDLRAKVPLEYSWRIAARERRALHVATDEADLWHLGQAWMESGFDGPLHTVEDDRGVARTIGKVVELELAGGFEQVVVLLGRVALKRRVTRLLHDRTADRIGSVVAGIPGALAAVMNVATV